MVQYGVLLSTTIFLAANLFFFWHVLSVPTTADVAAAAVPPNVVKGGGDGNALRVSSNSKAQADDKRASESDNSSESLSSCPFRAYPEKRYYNVQDANPPAFLTSDTTYVYGKWPIVLETTLPRPEKMCVNQKAWNKAPPGLLPFADGTNPSIVSVERYRQQWQQAQNNGHAAWRAESDLFLKSLPPQAKWLATACMTNSQCHWTTDTAQDMEKLGINPQDKPDAVLTVVLVLDQHFDALAQTTLVLVRDAAFGKSPKQQQRWRALPDPGTPLKYKAQAMAFDDARLFLHDGQLWISYREGRAFGYESQVLNPVHLTWNTNNQVLGATTRASETTLVCCGRNMALLQQQETLPQLHALTWVDPITVVSVDTRPWLVQHPPDEAAATANQQPGQGQMMGRGKRMGGRRRLTGEMSRMTSSNLATKSRQSIDHHHAPQHTMPFFAAPQQQHRRLAGKKEETPPHSHIHGTNAFMVPWPDAEHPGSFLGIGHFHRPNDREKNPYARFGHHYTHTFFTVAPTTIKGAAAAAGEATATAPTYHLTAMSAEFVLPAAVSQAHPDAEVIQFLSGLELDTDEDTVVIAYGINDCEAAVTTVALSTVQHMLQPVPEGQQVVDLMQPWKA